MLKNTKGSFPRDGAAIHGPSASTVPEDRMEDVSLRAARHPTTGHFRAVAEGPRRG